MHDGEEEESKVHFSADRTQECAFIESIEQSCEISASALAHYEGASVNEGTQQVQIQPLTSASSFSQFKQVFVASPRRKFVFDEPHHEVEDYKDPCKYER